MSLHVNKLWPHVGKDLGLLLWWRSLENFVDISMHLSWYRKRKFKLYLMSTKFFKLMEYMAWCTALWAFTSLKFEKRGELTIFWVIFSRSKAMTNRTQRPKIDTGGKNHETRSFIQSTEPLSPPPARLILWRVLQRAGPFHMVDIFFSFRSRWLFY